jgi:hypothetical protein
MRTLLLLPFLVPALVAQAPSAPITAAERTAVVEALGKVLKERYVFPDVAEKVAQALKAKAARGAYDAHGTATAFAEALHADVRELGKDGHLRVRYAPSFKPRPEGNEDEKPTEQEIAETRKQVAAHGFGLAKVEILQGNVGYLDVRGFPPTEFTAAAIDAALTMLSGTDAMILDLRQNGGGSPDGVAYLVSHFFNYGDERHINDIYNRPRNRTRQYWTSAAANPRYTRPLWVLTSNFTFSGGEECAYDLQNLKRATLVGETTGGGANPGGVVALAQGFIANIPTGRAINPITKTNWEGIGVKPEIEAPAAEALKVAHLEALKRLIAETKDAEEKAGLEKTRALVEKGEAVPPRWLRQRPKP